MSEHGATCDGCVTLLYVVRAEKADARLAQLWAVLDTVNAMRPEQFKTGQGHLSPAFREINFEAAFKAMVAHVNEIERVSGYKPISERRAGPVTADIDTLHDLGLF